MDTAREVFRKSPWLRPAFGVSILILMDTAREVPCKHVPLWHIQGFNPHSNGYRSGSVVVQFGQRFRCNVSILILMDTAREE